MLLSVKISFTAIIATNIVADVVGSLDRYTESLYLI